MMNNTLKRMAALLLAMSMCLSLLSANVWAAEVEPQAGSENASVEVTGEDVDSVQSDEEISGKESTQEETAAKESALEEEKSKEESKEITSEEKEVPEAEAESSLPPVEADEPDAEQEKAVDEAKAKEILIDENTSQLHVQQDYTANVNYSYSSGVTAGTVRYISQVTSGSHYHSEYWGNWGSQASIECGTASISMALSYVGINKTPKNILDEGSGITYFGKNWGGVQYNAPSIGNAINNFTDGQGKYSPPIIHLNSYSNAGHYLLIIGRNGSSLTTLDPWECSVSRMSISGSTVTYSKSGSSRSEAITEVYQYYNTNVPNPTPTPTGEFTISNGDYHIISAKDNNYCLNVSYNSTDSGANIQIHKGVKYDEDKYSVVTVTHMGNGYYKLVMKNSGKAIDVSGGGTANGTNVQQYNDNGSDAQRWVIKDAGDGYYYIISKCSNKALDIDSGTMDDYRNVQVWQEGQGAHQKWKFLAWGGSTGKTIAEGRYKVAAYLNNTRCLDVDAGGTANSTNVQIWDNANWSSKVIAQQAFDFKYLGNGYYKLVNANSGKCLDVKGAIGTKGTNVQIYEDNGSAAQQWIIKPAGNGWYYFVSKINGHYLDLSGAKSDNGTNVQIWYGNGNNAQKWGIIKCNSNKITFDMQGGSIDGAYKTYSVTGENSGRSAKALVIFSIEGNTPDTNQYGREAVVDSGGKVTKIREYGSEARLTVPGGGFIVSGHSDYGQGGVEFVNALSMGSYVGYNAEKKVASAYRDWNSYIIENKYVENGGTYGDLPEPHKDGYTFTGWYTSAQGGSRIRKSSTYSANKLYAHWEKNGEEKAAGEQTFQGHRYELYDYLMTWEEAHAFCQAKGGHLATIASSQENEIVANLVPKSESAWIGATDKDKEGTFSWATGETFSYSKWEQNEPNDYGGNEDYAEILSSGVWNDNSGTALRPFICEYDTEKTTTSISSCTVTLSETSYTYDGKAKTPTVTVKAGSKTLTKGTDYEVSYRNNVEVGTAAVTITGKGSYTGSVERTFTISKENTPAGAAVFTVGSVSAAPGGQITVPVSITKNPGIAGFALDISYDHSLLTLKNATAVSSLGGTFTRNSDTVTWFNDANVRTTGKVFELTFDISASAGDRQTAIELTMHEGKPNVTNENSTNVSTDFVKGTVTIRSGVRGDVTGDGDVTIADVVKVNRHVAGKINLTDAEQQAADVTGDGDVTIADVVKINRFVSGKLTTMSVSSGLSTQAAGEATITVGSVSAKAGEKVSIPVSISGNYGIAGMALEFVLPSGMTLNSITAGDVLKDGAFTQNGNIITWYATDNVYRDGVILNLNVTAPESSGSYTVKAALKDDKASNFSNENSESVGISFNAGTVSVTGGASPTLTKTKLSSVKWNKKKKTVTVKWKKNTKGKGYEVQYSTDKSFASAVKTVKIKKNKTVKTTVKKLKKGTWYFRIRTVKGNTYSGWSAAKKVKVTK